MIIYEKLMGIQQELKAPKGNFNRLEIINKMDCTVLRGEC